MPRRCDLDAMPAFPAAHSRRTVLATLVTGTGIAAGAGAARGSAAPRGPDRPAADGAGDTEGERKPKPPGTAPQRPFPQHVTYAAGTIRPNHKPQAEQDADVVAFYRRWKKRYLVRVGKGRKAMYRVAFGAKGTADAKFTVCEGQGYGMMIVAAMAGLDPQARAIFDGLARFARKYRSQIDDRLMLWIVPNGNNGAVSAFDGDADIAYGLLLAHAQWGSDGPIDYLASARRVLAGLAESCLGPVSRYPLLGDWVDPNNPEGVDQFTTRTSDFMLGHFRAFATVGGAVWGDVAAACRSVTQTIQTQYSPVTGLLPEFVQGNSKADPTPRPADPNFAEAGGNDDDDYGSNACRVPWRLGVAALLSGDAFSTAAAQKMSRWVEQATGGDPLAIRYGYNLDGTPLPDSDFFMTSFGAPFGVAALLDPAQQEWLNGLYEAVIANPADYYEDSIALLCLLAMTGNWWDPTA